MDKEISVIITCHPPVERFIEECVQSVKAQTVKPKEIIIVLDSYEKPYIFKDAVMIIRSNNLGVAKSRDEGVRVATGKYLLFLDADDVIPENFLEEMVKVNADIVYSDVLLWSYWSEKPKDNKMYYTPKLLCEDEMLKFNRIVVTSLMKRRVYEEIGGFDDLEVFEDYKFFLSAMKRGFKFGKANTFMKYRQRINSRNNQSDDIKNRIYKEIVRWYKNAKI